MYGDSLSLCQPVQFSLVFLSKYAADVPVCLLWRTAQDNIVIAVGSIDDYSVDYPRHFKKSITEVCIGCHLIC